MATEYVLVLNDPHCGSKMGVLNPATELEYEGPNGEPDIHSPERYAWPTFIWDNIIVAGLDDWSKQIGSNPTTIFANGDLVHGIRNVESLHTSIRKQQRQIAEDALKYIYSRLHVKMTYVFWGTTYHAGENGDEEQAITKSLVDQGYAVRAASMGRVTVNGAEFNVAHKGPKVGEAYLRSNAPLLYLRRRMYEEITLNGRKPPACYLYGHFHNYCHVWHAEPVKGQNLTSHLIVVPALCPMDGYGREATRSNPITFTGMLLIKIVDGQIVDVNRDHIKEIDMRQVFTDVDMDEPKGGVIFHKYTGEHQREKKRSLRERILGLAGIGG